MYDFQIGSAVRFFKNASKKQYKGWKKNSHARSWEGAPKKCAKKGKKVAEESKKDKLIDFRPTWN